MIIFFDKIKICQKWKKKLHKNICHFKNVHFPHNFLNLMKVIEIEAIQDLEFEKCTIFFGSRVIRIIFFQNSRQHTPFCNHLWTIINCFNHQTAVLGFQHNHAQCFNNHAKCFNNGQNYSKIENNSTIHQNFQHLDKAIQHITKTIQRLTTISWSIMQNN